MLRVSWYRAPNQVRSADLVGKKIVPAASKVWRRLDQHRWGASVRIKPKYPPAATRADGPHGQCQAKSASQDFSSVP